ncbi:MAG: ABC transporter substrate-binding protein, partial [Alphaproteobacteria bacterium]|nr:ABC transporter substrate-binding protein [Alphaproteobacteria bacterium]
MVHRSAVLAAALTLAQLSVAVPVAAEPAPAIAMHGAPVLAPGFAALPWVRPDAPASGTLRLHAVGSFDSLNPFIIKGTPAAGLTLGWGLVYEPLMRRSADEPFALYGLLAATAELPADRSWIEFTLDARARFSDGSKVTVEDVIWSWATLREKGLPNARATWSRIERVEETAPGRVRFTFADGSDRELPFLVAGFLPVLPRARWAGRDFAETTLEPVYGSGPYVIDRIEPGRSLSLRRDPAWWGAALPVNRGQFNFAELRFDYFRDGAIALEAFKAGDVDFRIEPDAARWAEQYDVPAVRDGRIGREVVRHRTPSGLDAIVLNLRRERFADRRVRQAIGLALDFEWINATLLHGGFARTASMFDNSALAPAAPPDAAELALLEPWRGKVPDEVFGPPWQPFASDGSGRDRRPLREAARLLAEAGWTVKDGMLANAAGQPFAFEIVLRDPAHEKIALAWARNLKRLGIELRLR